MLLNIGYQIFEQSGGFAIEDKSYDNIKPLKAAYAVLGSGGIGLALASELEIRNKNILLMDNDSAKVETLKEQNLNAMLGNIGDLNVLNKLDFKYMKSVFIVSSDVDANKTALAFVKKAYPDV